MAGDAASCAANSPNCHCRVNIHSGSCTRAASPSATRPGGAIVAFGAERSVLVVRPGILEGGKSIGCGAARSDPDAWNQVAKQREVSEVDSPQFPELEGFAEHLDEGVGRPPPVQVRGHG